MNKSDRAAPVPPAIRKRIPADALNLFHVNPDQRSRIRGRRNKVADEAGRGAQFHMAGIRAPIDDHRANRRTQRIGHPQFFETIIAAKLVARLLGPRRNRAPGNQPRTQQRVFDVMPATPGRLLEGPLGRDLRSSDHARIVVGSLRAHRIARRKKRPQAFRKSRGIPRRRIRRKRSSQSAEADQTKKCVSFHRRSIRGQHPMVSRFDEAITVGGPCIFASPAKRGQRGQGCEQSWRGGSRFPSAMGALGGEAAWDFLHCVPVALPGPNIRLPALEALPRWFSHRATERPIHLTTSDRTRADRPLTKLSRRARLFCSCSSQPSLP